MSPVSGPLNRPWSTAAFHAGRAIELIDLAEEAREAGSENALHLLAKAQVHAQLSTTRAVQESARTKVREESE